MFAVLFGVVLPVVDELYWRVFVQNTIKPWWCVFLISGMYAFLTFSWAWFVFSNWLWTLTWAGASFLISYFMMKVKENKNIFYAITVRIGFGIGILICMLVIAQGWVKVKTPQFFILYNAKNIFN